MPRYLEFFTIYAHDIIILSIRVYSKYTTLKSKKKIYFLYLKKNFLI